VLMGQVFHNFADAEPLARAELDRAGLSSLFDRFDWFEQTKAECHIPGVPLIVRASDGGAESWLFLAKDNRGRAQGLSSWYSFSFRPVFRGNPNSHARAELLTKMALQLREQTNSIALAPMHRDDCEATAVAFRAAGWIAVATQTGCNWTVNVAGKSFAEYWAERPSRLRKTVKVKRAKANLQIDILTHFDASAWAEYEAVYADSWKPEEGAVRFLRQMAETEGAAGALRLGIARQDGRAIAVQLWTTENSRALAHKVAHRDDAAAFSPGSILSAAMFKYAIDTDKVECIDFGTGDSPYKTSWMEERAPLFTLSLFNKKNPVALLRAANALARNAIRPE
jgi:Acetyltransferase (GNAT) domain